MNYGHNTRSTISEGYGCKTSQGHCRPALRISCHYRNVLLRYLKVSLLYARDISLNIMLRGCSVYFKGCD